MHIAEQGIIAANPQSFELRESEFFGSNGGMLLERVHMAPSIYDFMLRNNAARYYPKFLSRLSRKGIGIQDLSLVYSACDIALHELIDITEKNKIKISCSSDNVMIHDYDPSSRRVLISIVDIHNPPSINQHVMNSFSE